METTARTYSVLLVSAANKFRTSLRELLPVDRFDPLYHVGDVASARRCLLERQFDIVVISTPLPDEFGSNLSSCCAAPANDCGKWNRKLLLLRKKWPRSALSTGPSGC